MVVIEDKGTIKFYEGEKELTLREGFGRLEEVYSNEPLEVKKVIAQLKGKYWGGSD